MFKHPGYFRNCVLLSALAVCALLPSIAYDGFNAGALPTKLTTTLNLDGEPITINVFGQTYKGVEITHIGPKGIAQVIGIAPGDVLLSLNTQTVYTAQQADSILHSIPSGDLELVYARRTAGGYRLSERAINYINPLMEFTDVQHSSRRVIVPDTTDLEDQMIDLINADRARFMPRAPKLEKSKSLAEFARGYAQDMLKRKFFSHTDPDGKNYLQRAAEHGVAMPGAENISYGSMTAAEAQADFMNEPANDPNNHRGNILNPRFLYVGVGMATRPDNSLIVVQEFSTFSPDQAANPDTLNHLDAPPN